MGILQHRPIIDHADPTTDRPASPEDRAWWDGYCHALAGGSGIPEGVVSDDEYAAYRDGYTAGTMNARGRRKAVAR